MANRNPQADLWRERARQSFQTAQALYDLKRWHGVANRAYYAAYQAGTAICVVHGDASQFPLGWNNPTHEQLPALLGNNGDLSVSTRRQIRANLAYLRNTREDADYRVGHTVDALMALRCLRFAGNIFVLLEMEEE